MIALRISGGVRRNMACVEPGASVPLNSRLTRELRRMSLVKLAQKGKKGSTKPKGQNEKIWNDRSTKVENLGKKAEKLGNPLADIPGSATSSPWDFPPKILVIFFELSWEREKPLVRQTIFKWAKMLYLQSFFKAFTGKRTVITAFCCSSVFFKLLAVEYYEQLRFCFSRQEPLNEQTTSFVWQFWFGSYCRGRWPIAGQGAKLKGEPPSLVSVFLMAGCLIFAYKLAQPKSAFRGHPNGVRPRSWTSPDGCNDRRDSLPEHSQWEAPQVPLPGWGGGGTMFALCPVDDVSEARCEAGFENGDRCRVMIKTSQELRTSWVYRPRTTWMSI